MQLPRPLASTSLATRCLHMHRLEVHRPVRGSACTCTGSSQMLDLAWTDLPRTSIKETSLAAQLQNTVHRPLRVRRALQVPAKAQAQGAQTLPGQACLQVPAQAQGAQTPPGQACLQCLQMHRLKVHRHSGSGVLAGARTCAGVLASVRKCTGSSCTGPSWSGVFAGARAQAQGAQARGAQVHAQVLSGTFL